MEQLRGLFFNNFQFKGMDNNRHYQANFVELFAPILPSIRTMRNVSHLLSAITEGFAIKSIVESQLSGSYTFWLILLSLIITLTVVFIVEGGISKFAPIFFGQIVRKRFHNRWFTAMFIFISLLTIPLFFGSPILSYIAGRQVIEANTEKKGYTNTAYLDGEYDKRIGKTESGYEENKKGKVNIYDTKKSSIEKRYAAAIAEQERLKKVNKNLVTNGHNWAKSHIKKASDQVARLNKDLAFELDTLSTARLLAINRMDAHKAEERRMLIREKKSKRQKIETADEAAMADRKQFVNKFGGALGLFGLFSSCSNVILYLIMQVFLVGAGSHYKRQEKSNEGFVLAAFNSLFEKLLPPPRENHSAAPIRHKSSGKTISARVPIKEANPKPEPLEPLESDHSEPLSTTGSEPSQLTGIPASYEEEPLIENDKEPGGFDPICELGQVVQVNGKWFYEHLKGDGEAVLYSEKKVIGKYNQHRKRLETAKANYAEKKNEKSRKAVINNRRWMRYWFKALGLLKEAKKVQLT